MAKLISLKVDVSKIDKSKLFKGEKGNYLEMTVSLNDEPDNYGNTVAAWQGQTKEEVSAKATKNFLGNGKVFWSNDAQPEPKKQPAPADEVDDDLGF